MTSRIIGKISLDQAALGNDLEIMGSFPRIEEAYDEFSSGYWKNCSLWNASGDTHDTTYRDISEPVVETPYVQSIPYLRDLVTKNFDMTHITMVRSRNLIDAVIVPHRDFVELEKTKDRYFRVFMVLEDNSFALHSDEDGVFQMRPGEIWFLDAASVHAAANFSASSRQSLCWDFVFDGPFNDSDIFTNKSLANSRIKPTWIRRDNPSADLAQHLRALGRIVTVDNFRDILFLLTKMQFRVNVPITDVYEWLVMICEESGSDLLLDNALALRKYMIEGRSLHERLSLAHA